MDLFDTPSNPSQTPFELDRDIVFFDIESTGLNVLQDRIVQIALIKHFADGRAPVELELLIDPEMPISREAMEVHRITPEMLKGKPTFKDVADQIKDFIGDADMGGYNSDRFDLPMLSEELARCGHDLELEKRRTIDVQKIYYKMEPRTLKAAYKKFCDGDLSDAHDALADVRATVDVLAGQIKTYAGVDYEDGDGFITKAPIKNDMAALHDFIKDPSRVDFTNRLKRDYKGNVIFNFGKYSGQKVEEVFTRDRNYYSWIQQKDFSTQVKRITREIMDRLSSQTS
ncbi:MAG: 3'-5' exonuclease [Bacteroidota bacterium]